MFEPIEQGTKERLVFSFDGEDITAFAGMTVAAALLAAGKSWFRRTPVKGRERGPYCMMGACYDCLVMVDGVAVQACMTPVTPSLQVTRMASGDDHGR